MPGYRDLSEGLLEMVYNTASAYVPGFTDMPDEKRDEVLDGVAAELVKAAEALGYGLDTKNCLIEGIGDGYELSNALADIEHELDGRF